MQTNCTIRALTDAAGMSATEKIIRCYQEMKNRIGVSSQEFFSKMTNVIGGIDMETAAEMSHGEIPNEFFHRVWSTRCSIEGRMYETENLFDIVQGNVTCDGPSEDRLSFYWIVSADLTCGDLGLGYKINVKIGPFWSDEENQLVLSASVSLMEETSLESLRRSLIGEDEDEEEEKLRYEILEEVVDMISCTITHIVNPYDEEEEGEG